MTAFPEAARLGDPIHHVVVPPWESIGRTAGAVVGAAVGAAALFFAPAPVQLLIVVTVGVGRPLVGSAKVGSAVGGAIGRLFAQEKVVQAGLIRTGAERVHIGGKPAARACIDLVACDLHTQSSPVIQVTASLSVGGVTQFPALIQGSRTVLIVGKPAARKGDKSSCDGVIADGMSTVRIGGAVQTCECAILWEKYQEEAKRILAPVDDDHRARNRMISAKYAELYLKDRRLRWAGLAAYASKQVGCAMEHAQKVVAAEDTPLRSRIPSMGRQVIEGGAALGAEYTYGMLGHGNRELFLDVYPMHLFFLNHGFAKMKECAAERFPPPPPEAMNGFAAIAAENPSDEDLNESLEQLALHEQINSLQKEIYSSWTFDALLLGNEALGRINFPHAKPADVILESGCTDTSDNDENTLTFGDAGEGESRWRLYDVQERMDWILNDIGSRYLEFVDSQKHRGDMQDIVNQAR